MRILSLLLTCCFPIGLFCQQELSPKAVFDSLLLHVQEHSLYRDRVNWDSLSPILQKIAHSATSIAELAAPCRDLLAAVGDEHGRVFHDNQLLAFHSGPPKPHLQDFDPAIYNKIQWGQSLPFTANLLGDSVGYVRIVGLPMGDNQAMAQAIQDAVCAVQKQGATRWVVDLRYNGGGNLFPMAEGIAHLIGEGRIGGAKGLTSQEDASWKIADGHYYYDEYSVALPNTCTYTSLPKIAVLLSPYTASSGEALAVMFKGRPDTRFFGQGTIGLITVTDYYPLSEKTAMMISVSYYQDRDGQVYSDYVPVDETYPFTETPNQQEDPCLQAAFDWLRQ